MTDYLIVGNGVAGNSAGETIRRIDPAGKIVLCSRGKHYFYYTPALPEYLAGEKQLGDFTLHDARWYGKNGIDIFLETEVIRVDARGKVAVTQKGMEFSFDRLLLACGGRSFVPPIPGSSSPGVFTLRTVHDAEAIRVKARGAKRAVVIGGGLLGLEAGNGLRKTGLEVTVVEFFPRLLPRQTDLPGAALLQRQMERMGFRFSLGTKTKEILAEKDGLRVILEGGGDLPADLVLISAGVRPEVSLAQSLGLPVDKAIKVDDYMFTSQEGIYAAGDLVEHRGRSYGIWPASMEQGRVAGANMAGEERTYSGTVPSNSLKVVGIDLLAAGEIDAEGKMEAVVVQDEPRKVYRKLVLKGDTIVGALLLGDTLGKEEIQRAIQSKKDVSPFKKELAEGKFDFSRWR